MDDDVIDRNRGDGRPAGGDRPADGDRLADGKRSDGGSDGDGRTFHATHDVRSDAPVSTTVVRTLAEISGEDVTRLDFSLYDYIDTDALDRLFHARYGGDRALDGYLTFTVDRFRITVHGSGDIVVQQLEDPAD